MTLIDPGSRVSVQRINAGNLDKLIKLEAPGAKTTIVPLTQLALDCFKDIQNHRLGASHYAKKYTVGTLVFTGSVVTPIALSIGCAWHFLNRPTPSLVGFSIAAASAILVDRTAKAFINIAPLKYVAMFAGATILYGAGKVTDAAISSYTAMEGESAAFQKDRRAQIIKSLTDTYDGVADELMRLFKKNEDSPCELYELQQTAIALETMQPQTKEKMAAIGLSPSEVSQVMNHLNAAIHVISEFCLELNSDATKEAQAYNVALLAALPQEAMATVCIPETALEYIEAAQASELVRSHTIRKYTDSILVAAGTLCAEVACVVAAHAIDPLYNIVGQIGVLPKIGFGAAGIGVSGLVGHHIFTQYSQAFTSSQAAAAKQYSLAKEALDRVYTGIAQYLQDELANLRPVRGKRKRSLPAHLQEALKLQGRLTAIQQQIASLKIPGCIPSAVTAELEKALEQISKAGQ